MDATGQHSTDMVVVMDGGDTLTVSRPGHPLATFDRDRLETAYLLRLEHTAAPALARVLRDLPGFTTDAIRYAKAADVLVRAGVTI